MKQLFFILTLFSAFQVNAQENRVDSFIAASENFDSFRKKIREDSVFSFRSRKGYVPVLFHNLGRQATFPFRMNGRQFIYLGSVAAVTLGLIYYDQELDKLFKPVKNDNPFIADVSPHVTELGDYYGYMALAGYGLYSIVFHKYKAFRTSLLASQAAITAGLWIRAGKILSGRMRPGLTYTDKEFHSDHWFGPFAQFDSKKFFNRGVAGFDAFPSGHTGAAFAMATVISEEYKMHKGIPVAMYSLATIVAVTRLIEHEHWISDDFVGGIIGYLCAKQIVKNEHKQFPQYKTAQRKYRSYIFPYSYAGVNGVTLKIEY